MTATAKLARRLRAALGEDLRARLRRDEAADLAHALVEGGLRPDASPLALALALLDRADELAAHRARLVGELDRLGASLAIHGPAAAPVLLHDHAALVGLDGRAAEDADAVVEAHAR